MLQLQLQDRTTKLRIKTTATVLHTSINYTSCYIFVFLLSWSLYLLSKKKIKNQSKRENERKWELREPKRGRPTTTTPSPDHPHNLATIHTTKHSGIHHTHNYITPIPPLITHHHQSTTTFNHPTVIHPSPPQPPWPKPTSLWNDFHDWRPKTQDPQPPPRSKTHNLHHEGTTMTEDLKLKTHDLHHESTFMPIWDEIDRRNKA